MTVLEETVGQLMTDHCPPEAVEAAAGSWSETLWQRVEDLGLTTVGVPEAAGGAGGDLQDVVAVVRTAARHAAPIPLAETAMLAAWACARSGLALAPGPATVVLARPDAPFVARRAGATWVVDGRTSRVPWASVARWLVVPVTIAGSSTPAVVRVPAAVGVITPGTNVAGELRDGVELSAAEVPDQSLREVDVGFGEVLMVQGALARAAQIAGALEGALELTVRYACEREQFGRPIARFQAVQHMIAELAAETVATSIAVDTAVAALVTRDGAAEVAAAKVRAGAAATRGSKLAHQVHGAIGVTREHRLHHLTRRLWAWRDEFGSDAAWALRLGRALREQGHAALWPGVTGTPAITL